MAQIETERDMKVSVPPIACRVANCVVLSFVLLTGCRDRCRPSPEEEVRRTVQRVFGQTLPDNATNLQAISYEKGPPHDHLNQLFVSFSTDANGLADISRVFGGPNVQVQDRFNGPQGMVTFLIACGLQEELNVQVFDPVLIRQLASYSKPRPSERISSLSYQKAGEDMGYTILLLRDRNVVYVSMSW